MKGFPTLKIFRAGEEIAQHRGGRDMATMDGVLQKNALESQLAGVAADPPKTQEEKKKEEAEEDPEEVRRDVGVIQGLVGWNRNSKKGRGLLEKHQRK